jgi:hypothetical protein
MHLFSGLDPDDAVKSLLAVIFVGVGLLLTFLLGQVSTLTCNRVADADRCVLRVNWMGLARLGETTIEGLQGARVDESCDEDGCTYRVVVVTALDSIPLEKGYSSGKTAKDESAEKINAFVRDRQIRDLEVSAGGGLWLVIPVIFLGMGVWMAGKPLKNALLGLFSRSN